MSSAQRHIGKVKFFNEGKRFGFIIDNSDKKEYFVHTSNVNTNDGLHENDEVEFEVEEGKKGLQAVNVEYAR